MTIDWKRRLREFAVYAGAGLFLAFIGPFNATPGEPFWVTALYWIGLIMLGSLTAQATGALIDRFWPDMPVLANLAAVSVSAAIAATCGVLALEYLFIGRNIPTGYLPNLFGLVWVISAAMTAVGYMADKSILAPPPVTAPEGAGPVETFLSRLPLKYRQAELYAVSSEDHYLRVHTSAGEELILMRLADAVRELEGSGGLQVHRSWWVAQGAVKDVKRAAGKVTLVLTSGKEAPVSRTFQPGAKAAGLL